MALKVLHLSTYDANGGAARAAYSLHRALLSHGVTSRMRVGIKHTYDPTVVQGNTQRFKTSSFLDRQLWRTQKSPVTTWRSPGRFSSMSANEINASGADVINLHWITDGYLSVEEIGKIEIPVVWSMYDMWPFSGTEHYGNLDSQRWRDGYQRQNRPADESGFDLDRWTFERKVKSWSPRRARFHMIPASHWLEDAIRQSSLMAGWPITRIPHVVDTDVFAPMSKSLARSRLDLPSDAPIVLFLASAGISDRRKGWDLLVPALAQASDNIPDLQVMVAGPIPKEREQVEADKQSSTAIRWYGKVTSDAELRYLYAAADAVAIPSREDNLPLTALEALSVGCSIVGFRVGGLREIGEQVENCYLSEPEDVDELSAVLVDVLKSSDRERVRRQPTNLWSREEIGLTYLNLYRRVISDRLELPRSQ